MLRRLLLPSTVLQNSDQLHQRSMAYRLKEASLAELHRKSMDLLRPVTLLSQTLCLKNTESLLPVKLIPIASPLLKASRSSPAAQPVPLNHKRLALSTPPNPLTLMVSVLVHHRTVMLLPVQGTLDLILRSLKLYLRRTVLPLNVTFRIPMECQARRVWIRSMVFPQAAQLITRPRLLRPLILLLLPGMLQVTVTSQDLNFRNCNFK